MGRTPGAKDKKPRKKREDDHKPWLSSPIYQDATKEVNPEYNSRRIRFQLEISPVGDLPAGDERAMVEVMTDRLKHYLDCCDKYEMKIGNQACYYALGISNTDACRWSQGIGVSNELCNFIKKVQQFCAMYREGMMEDGKINPVTGIFWQKNYDGMRDQQEVVVATHNPLGETPDPDRLAQKYLDNTYTAAGIEDHNSDTKAILDSEKISEKL